MKGVINPPAVLLSLAFAMITQASFAGAQVDVYGTFHALGITVDIDSADDSNGNAQASLKYRLTGAVSFESGMPLTRTSPTRFVGSVFGAIEGTDYELEIEFNDDGPLDGQVMSQFARTRDPILISVADSTYVVSPSGSGTICSQETPCTLDQAMAEAGPGDEVVLQGGIYYTGDIRPPRSGTIEAPIVIRAQLGVSVVLDGADPATFTWTSVGGGVYQSAAPYPNIHLVTSDGKRLLAYRSLADLQNLLWGVPGSYTDGTTLWVRLADNQNPIDSSLAISRFNNAFLVEEDHIHFIGLTFRHYGYGDFAEAIYFNNASNNLVSHCKFILNDTGVSIKRESHGNVIQDSEFSDTLFEWPWDAVKDSRGDPLTEAGAIQLFSPVTGRGNVFRRNVVHDVFDGMGVCPESTNGVVNETDVYNNLVYRAADDGLTTDGTCSNVRLWNNVIHTALVGISMAPSQVGPTFAYRNLIYNTGAGNNNFPGTAFKFNSGFGQSGPMYLFHNTVDAVRESTSAIEIKIPGSWAKIVAVNNIWVGTDFALENVNTSQPTDFRSNVLYSTSADRLIRWNNVSYSDLATFQAATSQEAMSIETIPRFLNAQVSDYRLAEDSALRDTGLVLPGINNEFVGIGPDMGAFEYGAVDPVIDADADGVSDQQDNCTNVANSLQQDADADGYGNACDADFNNDCIVNFLDLNFLGSVFLTGDITADLNSDGVVNFVDISLFSSLFLEVPGPGLGSC